MERKNDLIIGMPVYNDLECFKVAVKTLMDSTKHPFTLVIIESGSTDGSKEYSDALKYIYPDRKIEVIHTPKEGPLKAYNRLFQLAKERKCDLYLTQTDVVHYKLFNRDWLTDMHEIANVYPKIEAVASLNSGGVSGPDYLDGFQWLGGWSSYYTYKLIDTIGGYDENFPNGYGVDIDHTLRIFKAGMRIGCINYWVDHHQMNAREHDKDPQTEQKKQEAAIYFRKKHKLGEFKDVLVG